MDHLADDGMGDPATAPPSGRQLQIRAGEQVATVVEVGGGLRTYSVGDRPVLEPFPVDAMCDGAHGSVLVPWPNRLGDGRYRFDGADRQLPLTEPATRTAIHGLARWRPWTVVDHAEDRVTVAIHLHPQPGYPFDLEVALTYRLGPDGLHVEATATDVGAAACPFGFGQHPYLSPGGGTVDDATLRFGAATRITTDDRSLPTGTEPVAGTPYDFATGRPVGDLQLDDGFTDLGRDDDGRAVVSLTGGDGRTVELRAGAACTHLQLFTGDGLAPGRRRTGLAVEPMTCPADAFRSGTDLIRLEPGASATVEWGVRLV